MNIMLGNLSVKQIEDRIGVEFPENIRLFMEKNHQPNANNIQKGKWHCFDMPFNLVCGDIETARKIFESLKEKSNQCKEKLQISISKSNL